MAVCNRFGGAIKEARRPAGNPVLDSVRHACFDSASTTETTAAPGCTASKEKHR